ncbi:MAG: hypothetical protein ABI836_11885 [Gemmatimonadota bacterium]
MRSRKAVGRHGYAPLIALTAILATGCAGINAPSGSVPPVALAPQDPFGGWAAVWADKPYSPKFEGELIAIGPDSVFVLVGDSLVGRSLSGVRRIRVVGYNPKAGDLMTWTAGGMFSTLSHGLVAFISAPAWLLAGGAITSSAAHASEINVPGYHKTWDDLRPYARFPQGIPAGLDRTSIRARPRQQPARR